jgi:chromosome segregation ATPase
MLAHVRSEHARQLADLERANDEEVMQYQSDFEQALEDVDRWGEQCIERESREIDHKINRAAAAIERTRDQPEVVTDEEREAEIECVKKTIEIENDRIQNLEEKLRGMSAERLEHLSSLKEQLSESLATLEGLEKDHAKKMGGFSSQMASLDRQHSAKIQRANEDHTKAIQTLTTKYENLVKKGRTLERNLLKIEATSRAERDKMERETTHFRKEVHTALEESKCDDAQKQSSSEVAALSQSVDSAEAQLGQRENELLRLRTEGEMMKREISRLRHEKELAVRRAWKK